MPTLEDLKKKGLTVPLWPDAAEAIGAGRTSAYRMAKDGTFPARVLRVGAHYRVVTADLVALLSDKATA